MKTITKISVTFVLLLIGSTLYAQRYPERRFVRSGNDKFERSNYVESEVAYRRALEKAPQSIEANYNLAGSLYKQQRFAEAGQIYSQLAADSTLSSTTASEAMYNTGNSLFKERKFQEAVEAYKNALRINPNDTEAKFNLAYAKKMIEDNKDKDKNDKNKDQNKDQNKNQDKKDNKQGQDKNSDNKGEDNPNKDKQKPDQDKDGKDGDNPNKNDQKPDQGKQNQPNSMNQDKANQMLDAIQEGENKTREKINAKRTKSAGRSGKNW